MKKSTSHILAICLFVLLVILVTAATTPILNLILQGNANGGGYSFTNLNSVVASNSLTLRGVTITSWTSGSGAPLTDGTNTYVSTDGGGTNHVNVPVGTFATPADVNTATNGVISYVNIATNGFVTASITNGLANTNFVKSATNGFAETGSALLWSVWQDWNTNYYARCNGITNAAGFPTVLVSNDFSGLMNYIINSEPSDNAEPNKLITIYPPTPTNRYYIVSNTISVNQMTSIRAFKYGTVLLLADTALTGNMVQVGDATHSPLCYLWDLIFVGSSTNYLNGLSINNSSQTEIFDCEWSAFYGNSILITNSSSSIKQRIERCYIKQYGTYGTAAIKIDKMPESYVAKLSILNNVFSLNATNEFGIFFSTNVAPKSATSINENNFFLTSSGKYSRAIRIDGGSSFIVNQNHFHGFATGISSPDPVLISGRTSIQSNIINLTFSENMMDTVNGDIGCTNMIDFGTNLVGAMLVGNVNPYGAIAYNLPAGGVEIDSTVATVTNGLASTNYVNAATNTIKLSASAIGTNSAVPGSLLTSPDGLTNRWTQDLLWTNISGNPTLMATNPLAGLIFQGASTLGVVTGNSFSDGAASMTNGNINAIIGYYRSLTLSNTTSFTGMSFINTHSTGVTDSWTMSAAGLMELLSGGGGFASAQFSNVTAAALITSGGTSSQFVKGNGSLDSSTYLTGNQTITLSGDATGSGATSISTTVTNAQHLIGALPALNGLAVTNISGATITSSNSSVTIGISKSPTTGVTNYDLSASGGGGISPHTTFFGFASFTMPATGSTNTTQFGSGVTPATLGFATPATPIPSSCVLVSNLNVHFYRSGGGNNILTSTNPIAGIGLNEVPTTFTVTATGNGGADCFANSGTSTLSMVGATNACLFFTSNTNGFSNCYVSGFFDVWY